MTQSISVEETSKQLIHHETHEQTLHTLLSFASSGHDVSPAAERVVRHCLYSPSGPLPQILSLALDVLLASPSHAYWVDTLSVIIENLRRPSTPSCLVMLLKIPLLPHSALQHLLLYSTTLLTNCLARDESPSVRRASVHAIASIVLRTRPLTAASTDAIRLEHIVEDVHLITIRRSIERLLFSLLEAVFDNTDSVAATALSLLTAYAHSTEVLAEHAPLNTTKRTTAQTIWRILVSSLPRLSEQFSSVFDHASSIKAAKAVAADLTPPLRQLRNCSTAFAQMAAHVLSQGVPDPNDSDPFKTNLVNAQNKAIRWIDTVLAPLCDASHVEISSSASLALLLVCSFAVDNPSQEKINAWGSRAVRNLIRLLSQNDYPVPSIVASRWVREASYALAALSKSEFVTTKFVVSLTVALLPYAATSPNRQGRLEALTLLAFTVVEYDLSGRDPTVATALKAMLKSDSWRSILAESKTDSTVSSELICCFGLALLDSSRKISTCTDTSMRLNLTHSWAVMLSHLMRESVECLGWANSPASLYAKEVFIKMFAASGQYSSFLMRSQGIGMEEYEHMQEVLVKATLDQQEVSVQAALLVVVTKYWLTSGIKAEANAGHVFKAIWRLMQEHYRDKDIFREELKTGVLWSAAVQGEKSSAQRAVEGGYISLATRIGKRTRAIWDTVNTTMPQAIEARLFGSIALSTAAGEGTTLTTDYVYSGLSALVALVSHNPPLAEKGVEMLAKYVKILEQADSADYIARESVWNTIMSLKVFESDHFPRPVDARDLANIVGPGVSGETDTKSIGALSWLDGVTDTCIFASSRLSDPARELSTVTSEEAVLHASAASKRKLVPLSKLTFQRLWDDNRDTLEGDSQVLHGSADPFSIVASHSMDTVKGLALIQVQVTNRTPLRAENVRLRYAASGALSPLPDAPTQYPLGAMDRGISATQQITLAVQRHQGFAGRVFLSVLTFREQSNASTPQEQSSLPYYIPSADVLLLRRPPATAGVDVFRRRWDAMRHSAPFHVIVHKSQNVDMLIDALERKSKCLRQVGRMRTYSHVCALVADSSRGDYIAIAALAPEARGPDGAGPCVVYATIRSNSEVYCAAFRDECREWLTPSFRVIFPDGELSEEDSRLGLRPQDAFFITDLDSQFTPYQRWRKAHAVQASL